MATPPGRALVGALAVALAAGAQTIPLAALDTRRLWPDAAEYVAIGNAWVHGAGFVNPVKWTNYLDTGVPFPAWILRAPCRPPCSRFRCRSGWGWRPSRSSTRCSRAWSSRGWCCSRDG